MKQALLLSLLIVFSFIRITPLQAQKRLEKRDTYYMYGHKRIEKSEISDFLKKNCPEAYQQYHNKQLKIGWGICVPSMALFAGGMAMSLSGAGDNVTYAGIGVGAAGAIGILSSMFVLIPGHEKRRNAYKIYNERCAGYASTTPLILNLRLDPQSFGMALYF